MIIKKIIEEALEYAKTDNISNEKKKIKELINNIKKSIKDKNVKANIMLGGSAAKGTFIGNDFDVDIFVMFDYTIYKDKNISSILKNILKHLKPKIIHGSRDYFLIDKKYEIIPVLKIKNYKQVINITDASPLHASWVKKQLRKKNFIKNEIKLAKLFFKSAKIYGAESYIKGLSGHVTDILVIYYGSFINMITAISKWKKNIEIDFEGHKTVIDKAKIQGPMIVIDPIQPNRNAAAAVDYKTYEKLKKTAKKFLKKPDISYFIEEKINLINLNKKYNLIIEVKPYNGNIDIIGAKLMKGFEYINKIIKEFNILKSEWVWDKNKTCYYCFKLKKNILDKELIKEGPSKEHLDHIKKFKKIYKNTFMKNERIYAKTERKLKEPKEIITYYCQDKYFKEKVKSWRIIK
jgi:tRNA nucleotidyltransferase (CCA-adding enzyme)